MQMFGYVIDTIILLGIYFLPSIIVYAHKKEQRVIVGVKKKETVVVINTMFGWTVILWLVALYIAIKQYEISLD